MTFDKTAIWPQWNNTIHFGRNKSECFSNVILICYILRRGVLYGSYFILHHVQHRVEGWIHSSESGTTHLIGLFISTRILPLFCCCKSLLPNILVLCRRLNAYSLFRTPCYNVNRKYTAKRMLDTKKSKELFRCHIDGVIYLLSKTI